MSGRERRREAKMSADTITRGRIAGAYLDLAGEAGEFVSIRELRESLPGVELDAILVRMYTEQEINLIPQENQMALGPADRAAALRVGGEDKHRMSWED
jgi:hypothetical protein